MNQTRQVKRSTKNMVPLSDPMEEMPHALGNDRTHEVYMTLQEVKGKLFSDQTVTLLQTYNEGRKYVVVFYVFDNNAIKSVTIKNRTQEGLLHAYTEVSDYLTKRGYKP